MREFQLGRYIKKWLPLVIGFFIIMTAVSSRFINEKQTYTASTVIEYCNEHAVDGLAPDGSEINTAEIYSSANMARVIRKLGLSPDLYSLDVLCNSITVAPVPDEQASAIREAVNQEGEKYTTQPTSYIVSCKLDHNGSRGLAQLILNELLDVYFSDYSSKHINSSVISNQTADILRTDYDYLEMVEMVDEQLSNTVNDLNINFMRDDSFRSSRTGYSYAELMDQFALLRDIDVSDLYAMVLGNQITKDKDLLINKYNNRIQRYTLSSAESRERIEDILRIVDSYVEKMRTSGNTDIDYNYILNEVYDGWRKTTGEGESAVSTAVNRTVQYDKLLRSWLSDQNNEDYYIIRSAYARYVIDVFNNGATGLRYDVPEVKDPVDQLLPSAEAEDALGLLDGTDALRSSEPIDPSVYVKPVTEAKLTAAAADAATVEAALSKLLAQMKHLYDVVAETTEEYNEYLGAKNIRTLSSTSVSKGMNVKMYTVLIAFFFLVIGCCGAILLGRVEDILEYVFLRDHATGAMNRQACDNYIRKNADTVLPSSRTCISLHITNQAELNSQNGRDNTDAMMADIVKTMKSYFVGVNNTFMVHNGGGHFFVIYDLQGSTADQERDRLATTLRQINSAAEAQYSIGIANAAEENIYAIRPLISKACAKEQPTQN